MPLPIRLPLDDTDDYTVTGQLSLGSPFTTAQASELGLSRKVLRRMVHHGTLREPLKGVFVDSAAPDDIKVRAQAAGMVIPGGSVVCDRTALWLHAGTLADSEVAHPQATPLDVFRLPGSTRVRRPECRGGTRTLLAGDVMTLQGINVTTPMRTALDLGRLSHRDEALAALDMLIRVGGFSVADLERALPRFRGARGVVQLRELTPLATGLAESPAESLTRLRLHDAGLPPPAVQYPILNDHAMVIYRLDLAYPDIKLAIEYDGRVHHTSRQDRDHDDRRRDHLRRLGWTFVVLTTMDVYGRDPQAAVLVERERTRLLAAA